MCFRMSKFFNMPKSHVKFKVEESVKIHVEPAGVKDTNVGGSTVKMTLDRVNIKANMQKKGKECRQNLKTSALQNPAEGKPTKICELLQNGMRGNSELCSSFSMACRCWCFMDDRKCTHKQVRKHFFSMRKAVT